MEFLPFHSSSAGNLYAAIYEDATLLIEAGVRIADIREALGYQVSSATGALITHSHGDHSRATLDLMRSGVDCYASAATWANLQIIGHRARELQALEQTSIGPFEVLPWATQHDAEGSLGFLIGAPDGDQLLFAVDTAYLPHRFDGLTHVAVEANYSAEILRNSNAHPGHRRRVLSNHLSIERLIAALQVNDLSQVREIWLLHLSDGHSHAEDFRRRVEEATGRLTNIAPKDWRK